MEMANLATYSGGKIMEQKEKELQPPDPRLYGGRDRGQPSYRTVIRLYPGQERVLQKRTHWHSHPNLQKVL